MHKQDPAKMVEQVNTYFSDSFDCCNCTKPENKVSFSKTLQKLTK